MTKTNDDRSLESRIEAIEKRLENLADMQLLIREYVLSLQNSRDECNRDRDKLRKQQTAQAVSELSAWQASADDPPA
jgi:hypothetical protein